MFQDAPDDEEKQELVAWIETRDWQNPKIISLNKLFPSTTTPGAYGVDNQFSREFPTWFNWVEARALALGEAKSSPWEFRIGLWEAEGILGMQKYSNTSTGFSFETPFGAWTVRNAIHLPTDKILLQLGDDQICLYDPLTQRIAILAKGRGPTAAIERDEVN